MNPAKVTNEKPVWVLFDWGDTLMRVYPEYSGPMINWPRVDALPGVVETLKNLRSDFHLGLATNAEDSDEAQIRAALDRVELGDLIEQIYCTKRLGFRKPEKEYFLNIARELNVRPDQIVMVGDSFTNDVIGAVDAGFWGIWIRSSTTEEQQGPGYRTIHSIKESIPLLQSWKDLD